ncbi:MAG: hypothetical protein KAG87_06025 [Marinobacter adhaerens]|nr:hypothetical protein [Marinobacter adhaerens]
MFHLSMDVPLDIESVTFVARVWVCALAIPADHVSMGFDRIAQRSGYLSGLTASAGVNIDLDGVAVDIWRLPQLVFWQAADRLPNSVGQGDPLRSLPERKQPRWPSAEQIGDIRV